MAAANKTLIVAARPSTDAARPRLKRFGRGSARALGHPLVSQSLERHAPRRFSEKNGLHFARVVEEEHDEQEEQEEQDVDVLTRPASKNHQNIPPHPRLKRLDRGSVRALVYPRASSVMRHDELLKNVLPFARVVDDEHEEQDEQVVGVLT